MAFRTALASILALIVLISGCKAPVDTSKDQVPEWAIGGTLHDLLLPYWAGGTDEDKLATAAELLYEHLWAGHLQTPEQIAAFRKQSEKLVRMMNDMSRLYPSMVQTNPSVAGWTARSFVSEGVRTEREDMDKLMGPASMMSLSSANP